MKEFRSKNIDKKKIQQIKKLLNQNTYNLKIFKTRKQKIKNFPDLRKNFLFCLKLENLLKEEIYKMLPKNYRDNCSLQFPMNIRLFNPVNNILKHKYSTDNLHTDVWSGAPLNSKQFILYLVADNKSSYCKMFKSIGNKSRYKAFRGSYKNIYVDKKDLKEIKYKVQDGKLIFFDSMCPHHTFFRKKTDHLRISIDFRVKFDNPYKKDEKIISEKQFVNSKIGQPGWGYYWKFTKKNFENLHKKFIFELNYSKSLSNYAYNLRKKYIYKKFKIKKVL